MMSMADYRMPTVEEVLAGETQGGVPRPKVSLDDILTPALAAAPAPPAISRWQAIKALVRIIFGKGL